MGGAGAGAGRSGLIALGSQQEGPPGANLFLFNLPNEWTQNDLAMNFAPFGPIVSTRVFLDSNGMSKCYGTPYAATLSTAVWLTVGAGFVSFENPMSAQAAVNGMKGMMVSGKRLKVELKKERNAASNPY